MCAPGHLLNASPIFSSVLSWPTPKGIMWLFSCWMLRDCHFLAARFVVFHFTYSTVGLSKRFCQNSCLLLLHMMFMRMELPSGKSTQWSRRGLKRELSWIIMTLGSRTLVTLFDCTCHKNYSHHPPPYTDWTLCKNSHYSHVTRFVLQEPNSVSLIHI